MLSVRKNICLLLVVITAISFSIIGENRAKLLKELPYIPIKEKIDKRVMGAKMAAGLLFGGFRGIIVDLSWMHLDHLWHKARFYKMPPVYEFITILQPDYIHAWVMGGWHMAYNMSLDIAGNKKISEVLRNKSALKWAYRGISFLESGHLLNPDNAELPFEIGWTYYHRLKNYEKSIKWFKISLEKKDATYVTARLVGFALEKKGDLKAAYDYWLSLKSHESYDDYQSGRIINKNIERLAQLLK